MKLPLFPKLSSFLTIDHHLCVSGGKKCSFFGKFGVLSFLETPVLRFALLPYYRRYGLTGFSSRCKSNCKQWRPGPTTWKVFLTFQFTLNTKDVYSIWIPWFNLFIPKPIKPIYLCTVLIEALECVIYIQFAVT